MPGWIQRTVSLALILGFASSTAAGQKIPETKVDANVEGERVVVTAMVPIPDVGVGAPRFTSSDVQILSKDARQTFARARSDLELCYPSRSNAQVSCDSTGRRGLPGLLACETELAFKVANLAGAAADATAVAETVRREAATDKPDMARVEAAELLRQEAVNKMQLAREDLLEARADIGIWQKAFLSNIPRDDPYFRSKMEDTARDKLALAQQKRKRAGVGLGLATPDIPPGLAINGVLARSDGEGNERRVLLSGQIRNDGTRSADVPALAVVLVDERGLAVANSVVEPDQKPRIKPGETYPFGFEVRAAPFATRTAVVSFASEAAAPRMNVNFFCAGGSSPSPYR